MTLNGLFKELLIKLNFLHNQITYGISKSTGRLRMFTKDFEHLIIRTVVSTCMTAKETGSQIMMSTSVWTIRRTITRSGILKYVKPCLWPMWISDDKKGLIQWKKKHLKQQTNCFTNIFIDDYRKGNDTFFMRQQEGDSLILPVFSSGGKLKMCFLEICQNRHTGIKLLECWLFNQGE